MVVHGANIFNFGEGQIIFFLIWIVVLGSCLGTLHQVLSLRDFPVFPFWRFMAAGFTSMIYFELSFASCMRFRLKFIWLPAPNVYSVVPAPFVVKTILPPFSFTHLPKINWPYLCGFVSSLSQWPIGLSDTTSHDYSSYIIRLEIMYSNSFHFILPFSKLF